MAAQSDWELIIACRAGDEGAWEAIVSRYERLVFSIALSYGVSREDAADVCQTAFLALFRSLGSLSDDSRLSAWLATVAHRQTRRMRAQRRHEQPDALGLLDERLPTLSLSEDSPMERWEVVEWLHHGLGSLTERCQQLLQALYFERDSPTYIDVAARLGIAVGSIGPSRARCLERLRDALERRS